MTVALGPSAYVHQGFWTDYTKGSISGLTLSLSPRNATVLVALLAIFVQITGSQLWVILQYLLHQHRASRKASTADTIFHQQQVALRNSPSDLTALTQFTRIAWAWRGKTKRPLLRSLPLILAALTHFIIFVAAGIFSSKLTNAGGLSLSRSPFCGNFKNSYLDAVGTRGQLGFSTSITMEFFSHRQTDAQLSQSYAQTCYGNASGATTCSDYQKQQLRWTSNVTQTCPFNDKSICLDSTGTITFDTGILDSHNDLGINAAEQDRVSYRKLTKCTPLNDTGYVSEPQVLAGQESLGKVVTANYGWARNDEGNSTFTYGNFSALLSNEQLRDMDPYQLDIQCSFSGYPGIGITGTFLPIDLLNLTNSDTILAFLSFSRAYQAPVNDPWFSAHRNATLYQSASNLTKTVYTRDRSIGTVGCTEAHQFCANKGSSCTPMLGLEQVNQYLFDRKYLGWSPRQNATFQRLWQASADASLTSFPSLLIQRDIPLLAKSQSSDPVVLALPDNQWELEMQYWHNISLAQLQRSFVEYGTGQIAANTDYLDKASTPEDIWLCENLVVRGTVFQNFSVLALVFLIASGLLITILSFFIEDLVIALRKKSERNSALNGMWAANETLQLQRMLYDRLGQGTWSGKRVPVTEGYEELDVLTLKHHDRFKEAGISSTLSHTRFPSNTSGPTVVDDSKDEAGRGPLLHPPTYMSQHSRTNSEERLVAAHPVAWI
jgi:hypothetical protein